MNLGYPLSLPDHQSGALRGSLHHSSSRLRIYCLKLVSLISRSTLVNGHLLGPTPSSRHLPCYALSAKALWCTKATESENKSLSKVTLKVYAFAI